MEWSSAPGTAAYMTGGADLFQQAGLGEIEMPNTPERQITTAEAYADALLEARAATGHAPSMSPSMSDSGDWGNELERSLRSTGLMGHVADAPRLPQFPEGGLRQARPVEDDVPNLPPFPPDFARTNAMIQNRQQQQPTVPAMQPVMHPFSPQHDPEIKHEKTRARPSSAVSGTSTSWSQAENGWDENTGSMLPHRQGTICQICHSTNFTDDQLYCRSCGARRHQVTGDPVRVEPHSETNDHLIERINPRVVSATPPIWDSTDMFGSEDLGTRGQPPELVGEHRIQYPTNPDIQEQLEIPQPQTP
jgi:hypothetical protein